MTSKQPLQLLSNPRSHAALHAAARRRAEQLRSDAQRDLFDAIGRRLRRAWDAVTGGTATARC
jgi:hypothetical protein